ncbi:IS66-like element accessory protein TnpA [Parapusillimonas granuli]|uniref:Transposase n=1 Tax=Parapusillimonas granuli TaxID=380911 RepID=A0A853G657_9BURK|nr:transposase [Parapusillimonas granuli]MBB5217586.1 hypothetical protein [Parapusillimonas granuli]NYT51789.1 transposase [Parapusillimonas granuli]
MNDQSHSGRRRRRTFDPVFKAEVVAACQHPGISVAAVALSHGLNANLLRRWVMENERYGHHALGDDDQPECRSSALTVQSPRTSPPFIPVPLSSGPSHAGNEAIRLELKRGTTTVNISWPVSAAALCAELLGEWLR